MTREEALAGVASKAMADKGKLIEAGWIAMRLMTIPAGASAIQLDEMRNAFMAGAQHLFGSIMTILDPEEEPTERDLHRMELIASELEAYGETLKLRLHTKGSA